MNKRDFCGWVMLAVALLMLLLCACGSQSKAQSEAPKVDREQLNAELDKLRELGLFHVEFEMAATDRAIRNLPSGPEALKGSGNRGDSGDATIQVENSLFYSVLHIDTGTGKLTGLSIRAKVQSDWEPSYTTESGLGIYDNFDVIMNTELTIGQYCDIWAEYQGYDYYELPEGVSLGTRYLDADGLDAYGFTHEGNGICIPFFRDGEEAEAGYAWVSYGASGSGPAVAFGGAAFKG